MISSMVPWSFHGAPLASMVKLALPNTSAKFHAVTAVYTLTNVIGSKIFNFNKFVKNLDVEAVIG